MMCPYCSEQIEVGEAVEEVEVGNRTRFFHIGHFKLWQERALVHYQQQLRLAEALKGGDLKS